MKISGFVLWGILATILLPFPAAAADSPPASVNPTTAAAESGEVPPPGAGTRADTPLIVAVGDSITFGIGDTALAGNPAADPSAIGFARRLARIEKTTVLNEGIPGENSFRGRDRVVGVIERWHPDVLLVLYSPNDLRHRIDAVVGNLRFMIHAAKERGVTPVIGTLTPAVRSHRGWEPFIRALNTRIRQLAVEEEIAVADHHAAFRNDPRFRSDKAILLDEDGLHPADEGYEIMARTWSAALRRTFGSEAGREPLPGPAHLPSGSAPQR
jgi:lysophospholipase L1-like esterase